MMDTGTKLVVGVLVVGVLMAFILPVAITSFNDPSERTINQSTGQSYEVTAELNSTVTSTSAGTSATVELNHTEDGTSVSNTVNVGSNTTYSMPDGDVVVTVDESNSGSAVVSYEYPDSYGWDDGSSSLYGLLPLLFVIGAVLFVVWKAMEYT